MARKSKIDQHFDAILAMVAQGMTVASVLASNPAFPSRDAFKMYTRGARNPKRRARVEAALAQGRVAESRSYRSQIYDEAQFDAALAIIETSDPAIPMDDLDFSNCPNMGTLRMRAMRYPAFAERLSRAIAAQGRQWGGRPSPYNDADFDKAIEAIRRDGMQSYRGQRDDGLPGYLAIYERGLADRGFAYRLHRAQNDFKDRQSHSSLQACLMRDPMFASVSKAKMRGLDPTDRADILQDMIVAALAGDIDIGDVVDDAGSFVTRHGRNLSKFRFQSLDASIISGSSATLHDQASTSDWTWEGAV